MDRVGITTLFKLIFLITILYSDFCVRFLLHYFYYFEYSINAYKILRKSTNLFTFLSTNPHDGIRYHSTLSFSNFIIYANLSLKIGNDL